jgi:hypothetical protein
MPAEVSTLAPIPHSLFLDLESEYPIEPSVSIPLPQIDKVSSAYLLLQPDQAGPLLLQQPLISFVLGIV